jgi:hypothetical protein
MLILHCPYAPRKIKKMIQHLFWIGAQKISKINYGKSYIKEEKKISIQKESLIFVYFIEWKKESLIDGIKKNYPEVDCHFIEHTI